MADHECLTNADPVVDTSIDGEPVISATIGSNGVEVYTECSVCGEELILEYQYVESVRSR